MPESQSPESADDQAKRNYAVLTNPEERLRLLEENVLDYAIIIMAADGMIVNWNAGAQRIMGWTEAEAAGNHTELIFTPEDKARGGPMEELSRAAAEGRSVDERWHIRKDSSRFWGSGIMTALFEHDGKLRGFTKILRDMTEQKRLDEELETVRNRERRTAEVLQRSILLGAPANGFEGLELSTQYVPAVDDLLIGGDFVDAFRLADHKIALVVGDVAGKGLGAAAQTAQIKFALRVLVREYPQPGIALHRLNSFLMEAEKLDDYETSVLRIVVLSLVIIDTHTGEALFSTAGMDSPLILRTTGEAEQVMNRNLPVGIMDSEEYVVSKAQLSVGDIVLLATDGITETRRGSDFLDYEGMVRIAQEARSLGSLEAMSKVIVERARLFGDGFHDDVCLLLARRK